MEVAHRVLSSFKCWRASDGRATWSKGSEGDGCLIDQARLIRGWQIKGNDLYNLTLFTSPPKDHRLFYFNEDPESIRVDIFLTQPFFLNVYVDGSLLGDEFDTSKPAMHGPTTNARIPILSDPHGSYAFDPHARRFYVVMRGGTYDGVPAIRGGGQIKLRMTMVVQLSLTMSIPVEQFDGANLIFNVATLLQIPASRIKIVSVQSRAQVAAQSGRRLSAQETDVVSQILEADSGVGNETATNATDSEFSMDSLTELVGLAAALELIAQSGSLATALGIALTMTVEVSDPTAPMATTTTTATLLWNASCGTDLVASDSAGGLVGTVRAPTLIETGAIEVLPCSVVQTGLLGTLSLTCAAGVLYLNMSECITCCHSGCAAPVLLSGTVTYIQTPVDILVGSSFGMPCGSIRAGFGGPSRLRCSDGELVVDVQKCKPGAALHGLAQCIAVV